MRTRAITFAVAVLISDPAFAADQDAIARRIEQAGGKVVRQSIRKLGDGIVAVKLPARKPVDELLEALVGCTQLRRLEFHSCKIGDDGWAALARLTGLEELSMVDLILPDKGLAALGTFPRLRKLRVGHGLFGPNNLNRLPPGHPAHRRGIVTADHLAQLAKCQSLESLDVTNQQGPLGKEGALAIAAIPKLRRLVLSGKVSDDDLAHVGTARGLEQLLLQGTDVTDKGLAHLTGLKSLRNFSFYGSGREATGVTDAGLKTLTALSGLTALHLNTTRITDDGLKHLARFPDLTALDLFFSSVTDAGLAEVGKSKGLTELWLGSLALTDKGLAALAELTRLRVLDLPGNEALTGDGLRSLSKLTELRTLDLFGSTFRDADVEHLAAFPKLETLELSGKGVTDVGLKALAKRTTLAKLTLVGVHGVTDNGLRELQPLTELRDLYVDGEQVTPAGRAALRKSLPKCVVRPADDAESEK